MPLRASAGFDHNHLVVLRKVLVTAKEWGLVNDLPIIRRLRLPPARFDWLTGEESGSVPGALDEHYPQWSVFFLTALRTGMRRGEIFGLHWDDVDLVARTITVRRSAFRGKVDAPKNGKVRTIPMTSRLTEALKAHRAATMKGELVFPGSNGKIARHQNQVDRPLHGALKRAGLRRIKFHELRHYPARLIIRAW